MDSLLFFPVGLFRPLQHAGFSRRLRTADYPFSFFGQWLSDGKQPACPPRSCFGPNLPLCLRLPVELFLGQYGSLSKFLFGPRCCAKHRSASRYHWCERH